MARVRRCLYIIVGFGLGTFATLIFLFTRTPFDDAVISEASRYLNITSNSPLIFVGGFPRSGTTLMRILLDTHPDVRCGPETRVIPRVLNLRDRWESVPSERRRLNDARLLGQPIDKAVAAFILEIMRRNGPIAPRLCNKDPLSLKHLSFLARLFPNAKFVLMLRDGRAVAHSVKKRLVSILGMDWKNPWDVLKHWDVGVTKMMRQCRSAGPSRCFALKYEDLVLQPELWLKSLVSFLGLEWSPNLLNHKSIVANRSLIQLSRSEKSTDQVINPIHINSLYEWCNDLNVLTKEFIYTAHQKSPLLKTLGYDTEHIPPYYGEADPLVLQNTKQLSRKVLSTVK